MTPIKPIQIGLINITRKKVATWQTHNIQLANFDVPSLGVIWLCSVALLGCLLGQDLMLRKHSPVRKSCSEMNGAIYGRTGSAVPKQRRRRLVMSFEMVRLDRASSEPLYQQLYRQIREELESGSFDSSASRVPSSRVLAKTLGISRPTVNLAFSKLLAEGYLQVRKGSGIFVADHLPATFLKAARLVTTVRTEHSPRVARRVTRMTDFRSGRQLDVGIGGSPRVTFVAGLPAVDEFPIAVWERLREQVLAKKGAHLLRYASSRGEIELRKAIAAYLCDFRGANCHADQIRTAKGNRCLLVRLP